MSLPAVLARKAVANGGRKMGGFPDREEPAIHNNG